jgi:hypothetical protein
MATNTNLTYEQQRLQNIERNKALIANLGLGKPILNQMGAQPVPPQPEKRSKHENDDDYEDENYSNEEDAEELEDDEEMLFQAIHVYIDCSDKKKKRQLESLMSKNGAYPQKTFNKSVTHVIYDNGSTATHTKALDRNSYMLTPQWIHDCIEQNDFLPEDSYEVFDNDDEEEFEDEEDMADNIDDWLVGDDEDFD